MTMTPRERLLTAYRHGVPDAVPVSPEIWDATALAVSGRPFHELIGPFARKPWWQTHLAAFEYFEADAWILAEPGETAAQQDLYTAESRFLNAETIETHRIYRTPRGTLSSVAHTTPTYAQWLVEHPIKRFPDDQEIYSDYFFADSPNANLDAIVNTLAGVGEKGLVTPFVGDLFSSFLGTVREGGMGQTIFDLVDEPEYCARLQTRYIAHLTALTRRILEHTAAQAIFIHGGYSGLPIINVGLFRQWDLPVLRAVSAVCRERGAVLHLHQHGQILPLLEDLIAAGVGLVCPLLPPPQGDIADLGVVKRRFGNRIALKGNVDPFTVLRHGSPADVEKAVAHCIRDAAPGGGYVLGTADSTLVDTPFENIRAFVKAGRKYGA